MISRSQSSSKIVEMKRFRKLQQSEGNIFQSQTDIRSNKNQQYRIQKLNPLISKTIIDECLSVPQKKAKSLAESVVLLQTTKDQKELTNLITKTQAAEGQTENKIKNSISENKCSSQQPKQAVQQYLNNHMNYMKHLKGDCLCGNCVCGKCKCPQANFKPEHQQTKSTIYRNDFQPTKRQIDLPCPNMDFYSSFYQRTPNTKFQINSTNRADYKPQEQTVKHYKRVNKEIENQPFNGTSSYKNNFIDWQYSAADIEKPKHEQTIIPELKFIGNTIYRDNYAGSQPKRQNEDLKFSIQWAKRPNLRWPDFPLQDLTTNEDTYKPFKQKMIGNFQSPQTFKISPSFKGQFQSTSQKEYYNVGSIQCPSRKQLHEQHVQNIEENNKKFASLHI